jgi:hypothetical protein
MPLSEWIWAISCFKCHVLCSFCVRLVLAELCDGYSSSIPRILIVPSLETTLDLGWFR